MFHYSQGIHTKQAHKGIPESCYEEEQGRSGFFGPVSHLIKKKPSTRWKQIEGPLKPRMFDLAKSQSEKNFYQRLLFNSHLEIAMEWKVSVKEKEVESFRNADGDSIYFCHKGKGKILTEYGLLEYREEDYIVIPKCVPHAFLPENGIDNFLVILSKSSSFLEPDRGLLGRNALYDKAQICTPDLDAQTNFLSKSNISSKKVLTRHSNESTSFSYKDCVYDTIGWKGDFFPFALNMDQIMPINSHRSHLPPSAHSTFVAREFVLCSFLPRPIETDKDVLKVPFYHQNIDYDEILFYHKGDFFSRSNLHPAMMSFHPAGFPHGPHPKAVKTIEDKKFHNEYAVMIDSRWPLQRDKFLDEVEDKDYWKSWQE